MTHKINIKSGSDPFDSAVAQLEHVKTLTHGHHGSGHGTGGDNAIYGGMSKSANYFYEHPCHAYMSSVGLDADVVYSKFMMPSHEKEKNRKAGEEYFSWITGKDSPWKSAFETGMSFKTKEHFNQKFWFSHGFIFDRLDKIPSNLLHNFLVASRIAKEWPTRIYHWYSLHKDGLSPEMALVMATVFGVPDECKKTTADVKDFYDWPLDATSSKGDTYVSNFLHHKMDEKVFNKPYKVSHQYTPVNKIWGPGVPAGNGAYGMQNSYRGESPDRVLFGLYGKKFGKYESTTQGFGEAMQLWKCTDEDILEIGLREEKRLG